MGTNVLITTGDLTGRNSEWAKEHPNPGGVIDKTGSQAVISKTGTEQMEQRKNKDASKEIGEGVVSEIAQGKELARQQ